MNEFVKTFQPWSDPPGDMKTFPPIVSSSFTTSEALDRGGGKSLLSMWKDGEKPKFSFEDAFDTFLFKEFREKTDEALRRARQGMWDTLHEALKSSIAKEEENLSDKERAAILFFSGVPWQFEDGKMVFERSGICKVDGKWLVGVAPKQS